jgi:hypothetical protein
MELAELDRKFTVTVTSTDTNHTQFGLTNNQAAQLQPQDLMANTFLYANVAYRDTLVSGQVVPASGGTQGTNVGPDLGEYIGTNPTGVNFSRNRGLQLGSYFTDYEVFIITNIGAKDSAGTGNTLITAQRCYFGPGARDMGGSIIASALVNASVVAQNAVANFQSGDELVRLLPAFREGTGAPDGFHKNPVIDRNFTQLFKYAVAITEESKIEKNKMPKQPLDMNRWLTTRRMNLDVERSFLLGRKGKSIDAEGKALYTMGGILEYIPKTEENIHFHQPNAQGKMTYITLLDTLEPVFYDGGAEERFLFCGPDVYVDMKKAFYDSGYMRYDPEQSKKFDIPIESIVVAGGVLNVVPLYSLWEANFKKAGIILDMSKDAFVPVTHAGWDMIVKKNIQPTDSNTQKEMIQGIKGLERKYADHQHIVYF